MRIRTKSSVVTHLLIFLGSLSACGGSAASVHQPNIVMVLVDDLGTEGVGSYGGLSIHTPRIDSLSADGMRFTQAHTTPLCTPTRVRLMTGRGGLRNYVDFATLHPEEVTFAAQLRDAGYETGVAGKWQLLGGVEPGTESSPKWSGSSPSHAGFDHWCLWQTQGRGSRYFDPTLDIDGETNIYKGKYGPEMFVDWAEAFMSQEREAPFLLYYPMALPHDPFVGTPLSRPDSDPEFANETVAERDQRHFEDMVAEVDVLVGRLLDKIEELGIADDTLFVFATDNSHSRQVTLTTEGREYSGRKYITSDLGTRVPLIVRWPGKIDSGQESGALVDLMDLMPTFIEAGHAELPGGVTLDGKSLLPLLVKGEPFERDALTFWYHPRPHDQNTQECRWARGPQYKLYGDGNLFDLDEDPRELRPLAIESDSEAESAARTVLQDHLNRMPSKPARVTPN